MHIVSKALFCTKNKTKMNNNNLIYNQKWNKIYKMKISKISYNKAYTYKTDTKQINLSVSLLKIHR